jgi:hypothetical protein
MNEAHLSDLMILVERAVRPVQAVTARKQKMREELLAHVTAVFEDEAAKLGDDRLALERTRQRLGDAAELTRELQDSVSRRDRYGASLEHFFMGAGVPKSRLALRYAGLGLLPAALMLWGFYVQGRLAEWPLALAGVVLAFCAIYLLHGVRDALFGTAGRSFLRAAPLVVAAWLLVPGVTFAVCLLMSGDWVASLSNVPPLLPPAIVTPAVLIWAAYVITVNTRPAARWESLQIA